MANLESDRNNKETFTDDDILRFLGPVEIGVRMCSQEFECLQGDTPESKEIIKDLFNQLKDKPNTPIMLKKSTLAVIRDMDGSLLDPTNLRFTLEIVKKQTGKTAYIRVWGLDEARKLDQIERSSNSTESDVITEYDTVSMSAEETAIGKKGKVGTLPDEKRAELDQTLHPEKHKANAREAAIELFKKLNR